MGKTTTARLFTEELLGLRAKDDAIPVPVLFDLRDISAAALPAQPTLKAVVQQLLDATGSAEQVTGEQVVAAIARGNCLVIFDGLDEVLVHLDPQQGQLFVRALWQVIDPPGHVGGQRRAAPGLVRRSGRRGCCSPAARTTSGQSATRSPASLARTGTPPPAATTWRCSCCRSAMSRSGPTWPPTFRAWTWMPCWR